MTDKKIYQQQKQAQLDQWKAELDGLKAKVSGMSAETRLEANRHIQTLEKKIEESKTKLAELAKASDDTWETIRDGVESAWVALKSALKDVSSKLTPSSKTPANSSASKPVSSRH